MRVVYVAALSNALVVVHFVYFRAITKGERETGDDEPSQSVRDCSKCEDMHLFLLFRLDWIANFSL